MPADNVEPCRFPDAEALADPQLFEEMKRRGLAEQRDDNSWWLTEKGCQAVDAARLAEWPKEER